MQKMVEAVNEWKNTRPMHKQEKKDVEKTQDALFLVCCIHLVCGLPRCHVLKASIYV